MTVPGALPPRQSVYAPPAIPPEQMNAEEQKQYRLAQFAAVTLAAAEMKKQIGTNVTLALMPLLRALDPYNEVAIAEFARRAAVLVNAGRVEVAKTSWAAVAQRVSVYGSSLNGRYAPPTDGRTTDLEIAYRRVASDYRRRKAAGVSSIPKLIAQAEGERYQALGGAVVAQGRAGETNAQVKGSKRSPTASGGTQSPSESGAGSSTSSAGRSGSSGSGGSGSPTKSDGGRRSSTPADAKPDRDVNRTEDDLNPAEQAIADREAAAELAAEEADRAEQELRDAAALSEEERNQLLDQMAQHEMEMRAERMVRDDMAMAGRAATRDAVLSAPRGVIVGMRRVLHPELAESGQSCGLCIAASHRIYSVRSLMPLHNLCNCEPVEVYKNDDPGAQINDDDLDVLYGAAGGTERQNLSNTKFTVFDHPELGPVLRYQKHDRRVDIKFSPREPSTGRESE